MGNSTIFSTQIMYLYLLEYHVPSSLSRDQGRFAEQFL